MTAQQSVEGRLVLLGTELLEQMLVRQFPYVPVFHGPADQVQDRTRCSPDHDGVPFDLKLSSPY